MVLHGRSPYGERGLKYLDDADSPAAPASLSLRRAWIEITLSVSSDVFERSLSLRRAWIEIVPVFLPVKIRSKSRSPYGERGLK